MECGWPSRPAEVRCGCPNAGAWTRRRLPWPRFAGLGSVHAVSLSSRHCAWCPHWPWPRPLPRQRPGRTEGSRSSATSTRTTPRERSSRFGLTGPCSSDHLPGRRHRRQPARLVAGRIADRLRAMRARHRLCDLHRPAKRHPPAPSEPAVPCDAAGPRDQMRGRVGGRIPPRRPSCCLHPLDRPGA